MLPVPVLVNCTVSPSITQVGDDVKEATGFCANSDAAIIKSATGRVKSFFIIRVTLGEINKV